MSSSTGRRRLRRAATTIGFVLGLALLGCLQKGDDFPATVFCWVGFAATIACPAIDRVVRGIRIGRYPVSRPYIAAFFVFTIVFLSSASAGTLEVPVIGIFVLCLFALAGAFLALAAETTRAWRSLATWVLGCTAVALAAGAAAVLGGGTHGTHAVIREPLETVAGLALFGLLLTPFLAYARPPRTGVRF